MAKTYRTCSSKDAADGQRRCQTRGLAFLEVTAFLPILVALLGGTLYIGRLSTQKFEALSAVRRCAWTIALAGCKAVPPECSSLASTDNQSGSQSTDALRTGLQSERVAAALPDSARSALDSAMEGMFAERVSAREARKVKRPRLLGGGTVNVGASYTLPCNSKNADVWDAGVDIFKSFL